MNRVHSIRTLAYLLSSTTPHTQEVPVDPHRITPLSILHPQALVKEARLLRIVEIFLELSLTPAELAICRRLGMPHRKVGSRVNLYNPLESLSWLMARHTSIDSSDTTQEVA